MPNPFVGAEPRRADVAQILVSDPARVLTGTGGAEGRGVEITTGEAQGFLGTHSVDVEVTAKAYYVEVGAHAGATWGEGWEY